MRAALMGNGEQPPTVDYTAVDNRAQTTAISSMLPINSGIAPSATQLAQARQRVADSAKAVDDPRARVAQLRRDGHPTADAEQLLASFLQVLDVMRAQLAVEASSATKVRPTAQNGPVVDSADAG